MTFVKTGLTAFASCTPFQNPELDTQGRCVLTDHGSFVVWNVYIPAGGANPLSYKMKFLKELRRCMKQQREELGKKVILVGDLNICHSGMDEHWKYRSIHVDGIVQQVKDYWKENHHHHHNMKHKMNDDRVKDEDAANGKNQHKDNNLQKEDKPIRLLPKWKLDIYQHWENIKKVLATIKAVPCTTKNLSTGSNLHKFRAQVELITATDTSITNGTNHKKYTNNVFLGKAEPTKEECLSNFTFPQRSYHDDELQTDIIAREENVVPLVTLYEIMSKIAKVEWGTSVLKNRIAESDEALRKTSPHSKWLSQLLDEDGMVDAFRSLYPTARGR